MPADVRPKSEHCCRSGGPDATTVLVHLAHLMVYQRSPASVIQMRCIKYACSWVYTQSPRPPVPLGTLSSAGSQPRCLPLEVLVPAEGHTGCTTDGTPITFLRIEEDTLHRVLLRAQRARRARGNTERHGAIVWTYRLYHYRHLYPRILSASSMSASIT